MLKPVDVVAGRAPLLQEVDRQRYMPWADGRMNATGRPAWRAFRISRDLVAHVGVEVASEAQAAGSKRVPPGAALAEVAGGRSASRRSSRDPAGGEEASIIEPGGC